MDNFCGPSSNFTLWSHNQYGSCYENLILFSTHIIFAVLSCYHAGQKWKANPNLKSSTILHVRLVISIIAGIIPLTQILVQKLDLHKEFFPADYLAVLCQTFAWACHSLYLWHLRHASISFLRGHKTIILSWCLVLASEVIHLTTSIRQFQDDHTRTSEVDVILTAVTSTLYVFYLITLVPSPRHTKHRYELITNSSINCDDDERQSLLESSDTSIKYSSFPSDDTKDDIIKLGAGYDDVNFISKAIFWWIEPLMKKGAKGQLHKVEDVFQVPKSIDPVNVEQEFNKIYLRDREEQEVLDATDGKANSKKKITLLRALFKAYGPWFSSLAIPQLMNHVLIFAGPLLLNALVSFVESGNDEPMIHGYYYAIGLSLCSLATAVIGSHIFCQYFQVALTVRGALGTTIYRKALAVSSSTMSKFSSGEIVNFMSTDTDQVVGFVWAAHSVWLIPFKLCISLVLLYQQIGLSFFAGAAIPALLLPGNRWFVVKIVKLYDEMMKRKDSRIKVMSEILNGIRVIKFYTWEKHFSDKIHHLRGREMKNISGVKYLDAGLEYLYSTTPVLMCIMTFCTYVLLGNQLTAAKVFTCIALFQMLINPLNEIPWCINGLLEASVSIKRLQAFMDLKELDANQYYDQKPHSSCDLAIRDGEFHWERAKKSQDDDEDSDKSDNNSINEKEKTQEPTDKDSEATLESTSKLTQVNLQIKKGQLVGVIGKVGSGKSSLLAAITAEMKKQSGTISVTDLYNGFGLATQESWIQHATLRENVLFGEEFNEEKYKKVLEACALKDDIKILPSGDQTEVGENGITLSGGQKARLALARAVYQNKDIYLLDGPLAAVDAHVGAHIFSKCIMGILKNKTRILCTHHTKFLRHADLIVVMENGTIIAAGKPSEILTQSFAKTHMEKNSNEDDSTKKEEIDEDAEENTCYKEDVDAKNKTSKLVNEEEKESGAVKLHVYKAYVKAVGTFLAPFCLLIYWVTQASKNTVDFWLTFWVTSIHNEEPNNNITSHLLNSAPMASTAITMVTMPTVTMPTVVNNTDPDNTLYWLGIYGGLVAVNNVFTIVRSFLYAYTAVHVAKKVHNNLLKSVLNAPIGFFDSTPTGRIINRFSSDVSKVDMDLPWQVNNLLKLIFQALGTILLICYGLPWFGVIIIPIFIIYYFIQNYYRKSARELRRISRASMSPIYSHFSETLAGAMTIRALKATTRFEDENRKRITSLIRARFSGVMGRVWLYFRLQLLGAATVSAVGIVSLLEHQYQTVDPAFVGLSISYALSVIGILNGFVESLTSLEQDMVSVERTQEYTNDIAQEDMQAAIQTPYHWPNSGCVSFKDVFFAYRPDLPNALDGVTFDTKPAEKLGIVGRTGSGKSSLFLVLFRMVKIQQGAVIIDEINACYLGLTDYRSRLAIIPQDPFLFSGTVRENLDPSGRFSDSELWSVLEKCHLREAVSKLGGLEAEAGEKGKHFSAGQRQLVCLGRAMLTRVKILCIDEATASVDIETDGLIQETIREEFSDGTVLTIAHRINTIMDSDRVIVMDKGRVAEFDTPDNLLQDRNSKFSALVSSHGLNAGKGHLNHR